MRYHIKRKKDTGFCQELEATVHPNKSGVRFIMFMEREDVPKLNKIHGYITVEREECKAFLQKLLLELEN